MYHYDFTITEFRLFMPCKNKADPNGDPWGAPHLIDIISEGKPYVKTNYWRSDKYDWNQL